jgi:hypothetical protein
MSDMNSRYLAAAQTAVIEAAKLNNEQIKAVEALEEQIKLSRATESNAIRAINQDVADKKLTEPEAIVERAKVNAATKVLVTECEQQIRKIFPSWSATTMEALRKGMDKAAVATVQNSAKVGGVLGEHVARTPFQAAKGFLANLKSAANKPIK